MSLGHISFRRSREAKLALLTALAIEVSLGPFAAAQQKQPAQNNRPAQRREESDIPRKRIEWFHKQRAFPLGFIPAGARLKALQHLDRMLRGAPGRQAGLAFPDPAPPLPSTTTWTLIGPQPINAIAFPPFTAGRITALAADPADPLGNTVYAGGAQGGIWKTTNGGVTWTPLTDGQPSLATGSIAIAPSSGSIVYVGTGEQAGFGFDVYYGAGVLKSTDGGMTWAQTCSMPSPTCPFIGPFGPGFFPGGGARIGSLAVNPSNSNLVLAGVQIFSGTDSGAGIPGIYCTSDGGSNWTLLNSPVRGAVGTAVAYVSSNIAYAALGRTLGDSDNGIYKSTTADQPCTSQIWFRVPGTGLPAQTSLGRIELGVAPSDPNTVYAAIADAGTGSNNLLGMFKTIDGGTTWAPLSNTPNFCNPQCWFDNVVRVHPANPLLVFIGGAAVGSTGFSTLFRSADGGSSWTDISAGANGFRLHVDHHAVAFAAGGTKLYVGNDGGVWSTTCVTPGDPACSNSLPNWTNLNGPDGPGGLAIAQFYPGHSIHPSSQFISFGGTQDNGTLKFNNDFAWTEQNVCGDGGWTAIDPAVPSTVYAACVDININKSVQNGAAFFPVDAAIAASADNVNFVPPFVIDPSPANSQRLYFGTFRVWQSTDGATTWTPISGDLTGGGGSAAGGPTLTTIAVAPGNSSVVYAGSEDGKVHAAFNVAAGTATFNDVTGTLPNRTITQIAVDPSDTSGNTAYVTFSGFSGQFPNPAPPPATIGDTQGHVFRTINGGAAWTDISCNASSCAAPGPGALPNTPVNDIVIDPDVPNTVYVATDIGVFKTTNANVGSGTTWSPVFPAMPGTPGLPRVAVFSLKLHEPSRTLRAATHGRSVWDLQLGNIPAFNLSSISPTSAAAGSGPVSLTLNGNGFTGSSKVRWTSGGTTTTITPDSATSTKLTATITSSLVQSTGTAQVTVDQSGSGPISNALVFSITGLAPVLNSVTPNSAPAGSGNTSITLSGSNFASNAQVFWNGSPNGVTTNPGGNSTQLTAVLSSGLLTFGSIDTITVVNPGPGGGPSKPGVSFTVTQTMPPPNDLFVNATPVTSSHFTNTVDNFAATTELTDPTPPCVNVPADSSNPRTKTVWYKFTAGGSGSLTADTIGSSYDTLLSVWTGTQANLVAVPNGCNDDIIPGIVQQSRVMITVTAGTTYYFMIGPLDPLEPGGLGAGGKTVFNVSTSVLPGSLAATPSSATINAGQLASFTIFVVNGALASPVTLSVTAGCPPASTCTLGSTSVSVGNSTPLNIATTARAVVPLEPPIGPETRRRPPLPTSWFVLALLALLGATLAARAAKRPRMAVYLSLVALVVLLAFQAVGCGGGGGGGGGSGGGGTTAGTYTVTITGTSAGMQQSTTVTLIVR